MGLSRGDRRKSFADSSPCAPSPRGASSSWHDPGPPPALHPGGRLDRGRRLAGGLDPQPRHRGLAPRHLGGPRAPRLVGPHPSHPVLTACRAAAPAAGLAATCPSAQPTAPSANGPAPPSATTPRWALAIQERHQPHRPLNDPPDFPAIDALRLDSGSRRMPAHARAPLPAARLAPLPRMVGSSLDTRHRRPAARPPDAARRGNRSLATFATFSLAIHPRSLLARWLCQRSASQTVRQGPPGARPGAASGASTFPGAGTGSGGGGGLLVTGRRCGGSLIASRGRVPSRRRMC